MMLICKVIAHVYSLLMKCHRAIYTNVQSSDWAALPSPTLATIVIPRRNRGSTGIDVISDILHGPLFARISNNKLLANGITS